MNYKQFSPRIYNLLCNTVTVSKFPEAGLIFLTAGFMTFKLISCHGVLQQLYVTGSRSVIVSNFEPTYNLLTV